MNKQQPNVLPGRIAKSSRTSALTEVCSDVNKGPAEQEILNMEKALMSPTVNKAAHAPSPVNLGQNSAGQGPVSCYPGPWRPKSKAGLQSANSEISIAATINQPAKKATEPAGELATAPASKAEAKENADINNSKKDPESAPLQSLKQLPSSLPDSQPVPSPVWLLRPINKR